jgi:hypothetical protein
MLVKESMKKIAVNIIMYFVLVMACTEGEIFDQLSKPDHILRKMILLDKGPS